LDSSIPTRPCWVEISAPSFENNYRFLDGVGFLQAQGLTPPNAELLAIVKADAYGHSLDICAPAAVRAGARWLGVTSAEEGVQARAVCPESRILVMGGIFPGQGGAILEHALAAVAWESNQLDELEAAARAAAAPPGSIAVHLEIDTGMSRQGASVNHLAPLLERFGPDSPLRLEAVTTHLYASDESNGEATARQLISLEEALARIDAAEPRIASRPEWLSVGASAALLGNDAHAIVALAERSRLKLMLRPGLALYGVVPRYEPPFDETDQSSILNAARMRLQPVLAWKTRVVSVRDVPAGAEIGYNGTFVATEPMRLALLAVGYADGLDRRLGNRFSLLVRGERAPIVGRISMDQSVLDVTEIPGVEPGDEVVILGSQGGETITAFDHADAAGTIPWEIFTRIGPRVQRIAV
jgi:alanine racemase